MANEFQVTVYCSNCRSVQEMSFPFGTKLRQGDSLRGGHLTDTTTIPEFWIGDDPPPTPPKILCELCGVGPLHLRERTIAVVCNEVHEEPEPPRINRAISEAINSASAENGSDTPDFILGDFLAACLSAFDTATRRRSKWYGIPNLPQDEPMADRAQPGALPSDECACGHINPDTRSVCVLQPEHNTPHLGRGETWPNDRNQQPPVGDNA